MEEPRICQRGIIWFSGISGVINYNMIKPERYLLSESADAVAQMSVYEHETRVSS